MLNGEGVRVGCLDFERGVRNLMLGSVILVGVYISYCVHLINVILFKASFFLIKDLVFCLCKIMIN